MSEASVRGAPSGAGGEPASAADGWIAAALGLLAALVHQPLLYRSAGGCDEWHVLQIGANILDGHVLYLDSNHIAGPFGFYATAALLALFGEHFEVGRWAMLLIFSGVVAAIYLLTRRLTGRTAAALAALWLIAFRLWTWPHFHMLHYATIGFALVTAAFLVLRAERPARVSHAIAAGILVGLAFVTKQDSGAFGSIACLAALLVGLRVRRRAGGEPESGKPLVALVVAGAAPFLVACAWFAVHGALGPYLWQTLYDPIFLNPLYDSGGGPAAGDYLDMPPLFPLAGQDPEVRRFLFSWMPGLLWDLHWRDVLGSWVVRETNLLELVLKGGYRLPYLALIIELVAVVRGWRRLRAHPEEGRDVAARAVQLVWAGCMWAAFSKPRDWIHLSILLVPFVPMATRQLVDLVSWLRGGTRRVAIGALATAGIAYLFASLRLALGAVETYSTPVAGERGTVWVRSEDAATYSGMIEALARTPVDRPVLVVPCLPVLSFLADRPTLGRFIWLWPRDAYADRDQQILAQLREHPDASIVYVFLHTPFAPRPQFNVPELYEYLAENYELAEVVGPAPERLICGLGEPRAPAAEDVARGVRRLTDDLESARARRARAGETSDATVGEVAGVATWPLTPRVLHVTPGEGGGSEVAIPLAVPAGARLRLRAGVHPDLWQSLGPFPVRLRVAVRSEGRDDVLLDVEKDVYARPKDRLWTPLDVDLTAWAGKPIEIVFSTEALAWKPGGPEIAGFEDPRIESAAPVRRFAPQLGAGGSG